MIPLKNLTYILSCKSFQPPIKLFSIFTFLWTRKNPLATGKFHLIILTKILAFNIKSYYFYYQQLILPTHFIHFLLINVFFITQHFCPEFYSASYRNYRNFKFNVGGLLLSNIHISIYEMFLFCLHSRIFRPVKMLDNIYFSSYLFINIIANHPSLCFLYILADKQSTSGGQEKRWWRKKARQKLPPKNT